MVFTRHQQGVIFIAGTAGAAVSITCTSLMVYIILLQRKEKGSLRTYERLMLGIGAADYLYSIPMGFGTLPAPKDTAGVAWAMGSHFTCSLQGFIRNLGIVLTLYHASLCLYFMFVIRYNTPMAVMEQREKYFHLVPILSSVVLSVFGAVTNSYHFAGNSCWVDEYPKGCTEDDSLPCKNSINSFAMRWIVGGFAILLTMFLMIVCMLMIFFHVRSLEKEMLQYNFEYQNRSSLGQKHSSHIVEEDETIDAATPTMTYPPPTLQRLRNKMMTIINRVRKRSSFLSEIEETTRKKSRRVSKHAYLYCFTYFLTWIWSYIYRIYEQNGARSSYLLLAIGSFFTSSQGLWTFLVFNFRKRQQDRREALKKKARAKKSATNDNNHEQKTVDVENTTESNTA